MPIKAIEAKIICNDRLKAALQRTHEVYNRDLAEMTILYLKMRKGSLGENYKKLWDEFLNGKGHPIGILETLTSKKEVTESAKGDKWKKIVNEIRKSRGLLFDREQKWVHWSGIFRRHIFDDAAKWIRQHQERQGRWKKEHDEWLAKKAEFEKANPEYLAVLPILTEFENKQGSIGKRRGRWRLYIVFFLNHPQLAAWRGKEPIVNPLTKDELALCNKNRRKAAALVSKLFFEKNPELRELDRVDFKYKKEFIRPWAKVKNVDGFKHKPTLTLPSATLHPEWITFQKDVMYKNLDLSAASVALSLIPADKDKTEWMQCNFTGDKRLMWLLPADKFESGNQSYTLKFVDDKGNQWPAEIRGIRLLFRSGQPYLKFSVDLAEPVLRLKLKQSSCDKYGPKWIFKKAVEELGGQEPITVSVDLGIRHLAAAVVMKDGEVHGTRFIKFGGNNSPLPGLEQIAAHKRQLRQARSRQGKAPKGKETCVELQKHCTNMGEDRFKKGASAIVDFARQSKADLILLEKLEGFIPDAEREKGINRALMKWNRGNLVKFLKTVASYHGIRVVEVDPRWLSQLCNRCNSLGRRYTIEKGQFKFGEVEKLFACPKCGYQANSDFNAAVNLYRAFSGRITDRPKSDKKGVRAFNGQKIKIADLEADVNRMLLAKNSPF